MNIKRLTQAASIIGAAVLVMAGSASANSITFSTNGAGTLFTAGVGTITNSGLTLDSNAVSTEAATLTYNPLPSGAANSGSFISYGFFALTCSLCTNAAGGDGATFGNFTFDLQVTDSTDGATGVYVGTYSGGNTTIYNDSSNLSVTWSPLQLGPGTSNASSGSFGPTDFVIFSPTPIVDPQTLDGETSVQGQIQSSVPGTPEPATMAMMGGALLGLGLFGKRLKKK